MYSICNYQGLDWKWDYHCWLCPQHFCFVGVSAPTTMSNAASCMTSRWRIHLAPIAPCSPTLGAMSCQQHGAIVKVVSLETTLACWPEKRNKKLIREQYLAPKPPSYFESSFRKSTSKTTAAIINAGISPKKPRTFKCSGFFLCLRIILNLFTLFRRASQFLCELI